jgi:hypothetical protein
MNGLKNKIINTMIDNMWHTIKEKPKKLTKVDVWVNLENYPHRVADCFHDGKVYCKAREDGSWVRIENVSHWMYPPDAPEPLKPSEQQNKTSVGKWFMNLKNKPSTRLLKILNYMRDCEGWIYVEDIQPEKLLKLRNCGYNTVKEFLILRNEDNPKSLEADLIKYRKYIRK